MTEEVKTVYKIRRTTDGLFSMGGFHPSFNKDGKIWKAKGHLTNHLNQVSKRVDWKTKKKVYDDCEIVVYEVIEKYAGHITLQRWVDNIEKKQAQREEERKARIEARKKEERKKLYEELKNEFEQ